MPTQSVYMPTNPTFIGNRGSPGKNENWMPLIGALSRKTCPVFLLPIRPLFVRIPKNKRAFNVGLESGESRRRRTLMPAKDGRHDYGGQTLRLVSANQCQHLGIVTRRGNAIFRHSLLNFGHLGKDEKGSEGMSEEERAWLQKAGQSLAVETVLKNRRSSARSLGLVSLYH